MVYSQKFVAVVVCNGRILRETRSEDGDVVALPFSSDYSLRFKNLDARKAVVSVQIDGGDVLGNNRIIVNGNDSIDLKGFMNLDGTVKNAFRFIKKTEEIVEHRGDRIDDGLIRVEWQWESVKAEPIEEHHHHYHHHDYWDDWPYRWPTYPHPYDPWYPKPWHPYDPWKPMWSSTDDILYKSNSYGSSGSSEQTKGETSYGDEIRKRMSGQSKVSLSHCNTPLKNDSLNINEDEGITVKGAQENQNWRCGSVGELETEKNTMIIRLRGVRKNVVKEVDQDDLIEKVRENGKKYREDLQKNTKRGFRRGQKEIKKPLFVNSKIQCKICGKKNDSRNKFCYSCGAYLEWI